jgi:hypothetical protein
MAPAAFPACGARRSRRWPALASSTTSAWKRGNLNGVSELVLDALARALELDDAQRQHLFDLRTGTARATPTTHPRAHRSLNGPADPGRARRPGGRSYYVAANRLGRAFCAPVFESREQPATAHASRSSTQPPKSSIPTGIGSPQTSSRTYDQKPAPTRVTAR